VENINYAPLTPLEMGYKYLFKHNLPLASILSQEDYEKFFAKFGEVDYNFYKDHVAWALQSPAQMFEDFMVEKGWDVSIMHYPRYLPYYTHTHKYFEIYYVRKGPVSQIINDVEVPLEPGDILIMAPSTKHKFSIMNDFGEVYMIGIRTSTFSTTFSALMQQNELLSDFFLKELFKTSSISYLILHADNDDKIFHVIREMIEEEKKISKYLQMT